MNQLGLFDTVEKRDYQIERRTAVRLGRRAAQVSLKKRRREAWRKLREVLEQLEGKDVLVSSCNGARSHFWTDNLLLRRLKVEFGWGIDKHNPPAVLVLWGGAQAKGMEQHIRLFLDQLWDVRTNDYGNYSQYLIDFWNGWGEYPFDQYRPQGYISLVLSLGRTQ